MTLHSEAFQTPSSSTTKPRAWLFAFESAESRAEVAQDGGAMINASRDSEPRIRLDRYSPRVARALAAP